MNEQNTEMKPTQEHLLPCPFCGRVPTIRFTYPSGKPAVQCPCRAGFHMSEEQWNDRATPPPEQTAEGTAETDAFIRALGETLRQFLHGEIYASDVAAWGLAAMADLRGVETQRKAALRDAAKLREEVERLKEDSNRQAQTILRLAKAAEDRNEVDRQRDELHKSDLAALEASNAELVKSCQRIDEVNQKLGKRALAGEEATPPSASSRSES